MGKINESLIREKKLLFRFLKENNCYMEFIKNFNDFVKVNQNKKFYFIDIRLGFDEVIKKRIVSEINSEIEYAFCWRKTLQGDTFWRELSRKWIEISKQIKYYEYVKKLKNG